MANEPSLDTLRDRVAKTRKQLDAAERAANELAPLPSDASVAQIMDHEEVLDAFDVAKNAHQQAKDALQERVWRSIAADKRRKADRTLAEQAGVPPRYLDNIIVKTNRHGTRNIFYGGEGTPDGQGRGHVAIDAGNTVFFHQPPTAQTHA